MQRQAAFGNGFNARMFAAFGRPVTETSIGVPKETYQNERRVAMSPEATERLSKLGFKINIERGAGKSADFSDEAFEKAGGHIVDNAFESDIVFKVRAPSGEEVGKLKEESGLISFIYPAQNQDLVD